MPQAVYVGIVVAAALYAGYASYKQSKAQAKVAKFNADRAAEDARVAAKTADIEANEIRLENRRRIGTIRAQQAASGLDVSTGSALLVQLDQAAEGEIAAEKRIYNGALQARGFKIEEALGIASAKTHKSNANAALVGGVLNAAASGAKAGSGGGA